MTLFTLTGPSGVGKNHVKKHLLTRFPQLSELTWVTTKPTRKGEEAALHRRYVDDETFDQQESTREIALTHSLYGYRYGLMTSFLDKDGTFLTELHADNVQRIREQLLIVPISIALVPQDLDILRRHFELRGTESHEGREKRIREAPKEIQSIQEQSELFSLIVTVSSDNEHLITGYVETFVQATLQKQKIP